MSGQRRQRGSELGADRRGTLVSGEGSQRDTVAEVALKAPDPAGLEPLARQDQVYSQAPALPSDGQQNVQELGVRLKKIADWSMTSSRYGIAGNSG